MKKLLVLAAVLLVTVGASCAFAQNGAGSGGTVTDNGRKHVSAAEKGQSDSQMQLAVGQLQSATSSVQSGDSSAAIGSLQVAVLHLQQALPIYRGNREKSLHAANRAIIILQKNKKRSIERASTFVATSLTDAQTALTVN